MKGFITAITVIFLGQGFAGQNSIIPQINSSKKQVKTVEKPTITPVKEEPIVKPVQDKKVTKPAISSEAEKALEGLQKFYDSTTDYQADFEQTYTYKAYGRTQKSKGKVFFKKAGKMRWNYKKPSTKYFIANGKKLWVYEPDENQAYPLSMEESQLPVVLTFLFGKGNLLNEFEPKLLEKSPLADAPTDYVIELMPKTATEYKKVIMVVSDSFTLKEVIIYDPVDNQNHLIFTKQAINKGIDDSQFEFTPPPGTKIPSIPE